MITHAQSNANTHILPPAHVGRHGQALSLDKRQRRRGEKSELKRKRRRNKGGTGCLTPFLEPSLSNDGDIAHGFFTPSLMPLHACSTERGGRRGETSPAAWFDSQTRAGAVWKCAQAGSTQTRTRSAGKTGRGFISYADEGR